MRPLGCTLRAAAAILSIGKGLAQGGTVISSGYASASAWGRNTIAPPVSARKVTTRPSVRPSQRCTTVTPARKARKVSSSLEFPLSLRRESFQQPFGLQISSASEALRVGRYYQFWPKLTGFFGGRRVRGFRSHALFCRDTRAGSRLELVRAYAPPGRMGRARCVYGFTCGRGIHPRRRSARWRG